MNDSFLVCGGKAIRYLQRVIHRASLAHRAATNSIPECLAFQKFRNHVSRPIMSADVVNDEYVWVIQRTRRACFLFEPAQAIRVGRNSCGQNLHRNVATQLSITPLIHFSHSSSAELRTDFVTTEFCAGGNHLKLISTTSVLIAPRESASCLPSRDQSKEKIWSVLKSVNCRGSPPSTGCSQMFETRPRVLM